MKKAFAVSTLAVWTLALLIGLGFAVVNKANGTNMLLLENRQLGIESRSLASERDSLLEAVKSERGRGDQYLWVLGLQNKMLFESAPPPRVMALEPRLREE